MHFVLKEIIYKCSVANRKYKGATQLTMIVVLSLVNKIIYNGKFTSATSRNN